MQPTQELVDSIYREKVLRARRRRLEDKLLGGAELFAEVCERMACGIRAQFPDADEERVRAIRRQWLDRVRQIQDYHVWK